MEEPVKRKKPQPRIYRCCVTNCANTSRTVKEDFKLFPIPVDNVFRNREWCRVLGFPVPEKPKRGYVCSDHFQVDDFGERYADVALRYGFTRQRRLRRDAVPSLLIPTIVEDKILEVTDPCPDIGNIPGGEAKDSEESVGVHDLGAPQELVEVPVPSWPLKKQKELPHQTSPRRRRGRDNNTEGCLICSQKVDKSREPYQFCGSKGDLLLNRQLWHTFVLRQVLCLPTKKYEYVLKKVGCSINPSDWFRVCFICSETVDKILQLRDKVRDLQSEIDKLEGSVRKKCLENVVDSKTHSQKPSKVVNVIDEIKKCLKAEAVNTKDLQDFKNCRDLEIDPPFEATSTEGETITVAAPKQTEEIKLNKGTPIEAVTVVTQNKNEESKPNEGNISNIEDDDGEVADCKVEDVNEKEENVSDTEWLPDDLATTPLLTNEHNMESDHSIEMQAVSDSDADSICSEMSLGEDTDPEIKKKLKRKLVRRNVQKKSKGAKTLQENISCDKCFLTFAYKWRYSIHQKLHEKSMKENDGVYDCFKCKAPYNAIGGLSNHLTFKHNLRLHSTWKVGLPQEKYVYTTVEERKQIAARDQVEGDYDCYKCKAPCRDGENLKHHMRHKHKLYIHSSWKVGLPQVDYVYTKQNKMDVLKKLKITNRLFNAAFNCNYCPKVFLVQNSFDEHIKRHEMSNKLYGGRLDCCQCDAPFPSINRLKTHLSGQHQLKLDCKWDGSIPQEYCITKIASGDPLIDNGGEIQKCSRCDLEFTIEKGLEDHMKDHESTPANLHCSICQRPYPSEESLHIHLRESHKASPHKCTICGFDARALGRLKLHTMKHKIFDGSVDPSVSKTKFTCNLCKETFKTRRLFGRHRVAAHHDELQIDVFKCAEGDCKMVFPRRNQLIDHIADRHTAIKKFQCEECGFGAISQYRLELHRAKHKSTQHICEYCSAVYSSSNILNGHILRYHPEKFEPRRKEFFSGVKVDKLEKEYGFKGLPISTHGEPEKRKKAYPCKYCDSILPHALALKYHLKSTHKDMYTFTCDQCERVYISEQSLKLHKKINHPKEDTSATCGWCLKTVTHRIKLYDHKGNCTKRPKGSGVPKIFVLGENPPPNVEEKCDDSESSNEDDAPDEGLIKRIKLDY